MKIRVVIFHFLNSSEDTKPSLSNSSNDQFLARPGSYRSAVSKLSGEVLSGNSASHRIR